MIVTDPWIQLVASDESMVQAERARRGGELPGDALNRDSDVRHVGFDIAAGDGRPAIPASPARRNHAPSAQRRFEVSNPAGDVIPADAGRMGRTRSVIALRVVVHQGGGDVSPCVVN